MRLIRGSAAATALASLALAALAEPCEISGIVVDSATAKPLAKTRIFAKPASPSLAAILRLTDERGGFCFDGLPAGQCEIAADHSGYLPMRYGAKPGGQHGLPFHFPSESPLPALAIQLVPGAAIAGTVLDASGEPREGVQVELDRKGWDNGWSPDFFRGTETDDRGSFRFPLLPPGTYYLSVTPATGDGRKFLDSKAQPIRTAEALTYYNGSLTFSHATPIPLQAGQEIGNVVLTIDLVISRHLSGSLSSAIHLQEPRRIHLNSDNAPPALVSVADDGTFSAESLAPTKYRVYVTGSGTQISEFPDIDLTNGDIEGLVLEPETTFEVHVSTRAEGGGSPPAVQFRLRSLDHNGERAGRALAGGAYTFRVVPGLYRLETGRASPAFVKSLMVDGQPSSNPVLDLRKGPLGVIEATLSSRLAVIDGRLSRPEGAVPSLAATLIVMDDAKSRSEAVSDMLPLDQTGRFHVESLAPGKYRLFAVEGFEDNLWGSLELAAALREKSTAIELAEDETKAVVLPVITLAEWTAALRKVGM